MTTRDLIQAYVTAFNAQDTEALLATLHPDVVHDLNEGPTQVGIDAYRAFRAHMEARYRETLIDVAIFAEGERGACEFTVRGTYLATDEGLPDAAGQSYEIPAAFFVTVREGKLARVTSYYNLRRWTEAITAA